MAHVAAVSSQHRCKIAALHNRKCERLQVLCSLLLLSFFLLSASLAYTQDLSGLEQGIKPYGSYHGGDIDSISMVNGDLSLHIPLISWPQRGGKLQLGFEVVYNNPIYTLIDNRVNGICPLQCYTWELAGASSQYTRAGLALNFGLPTLGATLTYPSGSGSCPLIKAINMQDPDGATHLLEPDTSSEWMSVDTTGNEYSLAGLVLTDKQGTRYSYNGSQVTAAGSSCGWYYPAVITQLQDVNGNKITSNLDPNNQFNILSYTDTMGRVIPSPPQSVSTSTCPTGNGLLAATTASAWNFPGPNGQTATFTVCYAAFPLSYIPPCFGLPRCYGLSGTTPQIQSIVLPNGTAWNFAFDTTGGLSKITFPTGGSISYTWGQDYHCFFNTGTVIAQFNADALTRTVNANDGTGSHMWQYYPSPTAPIWNGSHVSFSTGGSQTIVTDPNGNDALHTITGLPTGTSCSLYETELDEYNGSHTSGTLLRKTVTNYNSVWDSSVPPLGRAINVAPTSIVVTDAPSGKSSQVTKTWDSGIALGNGLSAIYGDLLTESDYDFTGTLLRQTNNTYMALSGPNASSYLGNNLMSLPYTAQVCSPLQSGEIADCGTLKQRAYTTYGYDESALQTPSPPITEQLTTGESHPGNQTSVHRWLNGNSTGTTNCSAVTTGYLVSSMVYYNTGEVQKSTDPCLYPTTFLYDPAYFGAYPTTVTNALGQSTTYIYDSNSGSVTSIQDPNTNAPATTKSYDIMDRLLSVSYPDTGSTTYCYTDGHPSNCSSGDAGGFPFAVVVTKKITSSMSEISTAIVDGLGRLSQTQLNSDPGGTTYTGTTYDALGRKSQVYNPTRCASITTNCDNETTWGVTTYTLYDALNRVQTVTEPDGSTLTTTYDQTSTKNSGVCSTVTDEAGKSRQSCVDGLGRTTGVFEDPLGLNYETDYTYDALNNLLTVTQDGSNSANARTRSFTYNSLSHLTNASNPESGNIVYAYDADGNVVTKTAPLPNQTGASTVTTTYSYDTLNRLTKKSYADGGTSDPYTPPVQFAYDGAALAGCTIAPPGETDTYPIGRRTSGCDGSGAANWTHDTMGRILSERRTIGGVIGKYDNDAYNLDGSVSSVTLPLGYQIVYTYNSVGQPLTVKNYNDPATFVTGATYAPHGALAGMNLGAAPITVTNAYNDRLQPILLSAHTTSGTLFSECFDFHLKIGVNTAPCSFSASTGNNGNVYSIVNNRDNTRSQNFMYDSLNRIQQAYSSGPAWGETFGPVATAPGVAPSTSGIDAWGNMTNRSGVTGKSNAEPSFSFAALTNNRLSGFGYDAPGNMTSNGSLGYFYDAENRLIAAGGMSYIYDGDGNRVEKCTEGSTPGKCASGATGTLYWWGTGSAPQAETDLAGNVLEDYIFLNGQRIARREPTKAVHFYFSDHLGSHAVVENATGTSCEQDIDYYPYGGQEYDYCSGTSVPQNYKFTGKERDSESGLDYFGARYDASSMGRFMTPDPLPWPHWQNGSKDDLKRFVLFLTNPQNFNMYSYVRNNPLNSVDPDGMNVYVVVYTTGNSQGDDELKRAAQTKKDEITSSKGFDPKKDTVIIAGVKTKEDFQNVLNSAAKMADQFGKTTNVSLFSHAGDIDGPVFHDASGHASQFTQSELSNLKVNWGANSTASFYGCSTADNFAQHFANAQSVRSFGFLGGVDFSGRADSVSKWYLFNGQFDRYMVDKGEKGLQERDPQ